MTIKKLASLLLAFALIITGTMSPSFAGEGKDINSAAFSDIFTSDIGSLNYGSGYFLSTYLADIPVGTSPDTVIGYAVVSKDYKAVKGNSYSQAVKVAEIRGRNIEGFDSSAEGTKNCIIRTGSLMNNTSIRVTDSGATNLSLLGKNITASDTQSMAFQNGNTNADAGVLFTDAAGVLRFTDVVKSNNNFGVDNSTIGHKNGTADIRGYRVPVSVSVQRMAYVLDVQPNDVRTLNILSDGSNLEKELAKVSGIFGYRIETEDSAPYHCAGDRVTAQKEWFFGNNGKSLIDYTNFKPQVVKLNHTYTTMGHSAPVYAYVQVVKTDSKDDSKPAVKPANKPAKKPVVVDKVNTDKVDKNNNVVVNATKSDKVEVKADVLKDISSKKDSGLTITLEDNAKVTYDDKALEAITKAAGAEAESIEVELVKAGKNAGNEKQQKAIKDSNAMEVYSISLKVKTADGVKDIHKFDGGKVTISVPFSNPDKKDLQVYRVEENGKLTHMKTSYEKGILTWVTDGHSFYMVKDADAVKAPSEAEPAETGSGFPFVWVGLGAVVLVAGAFIFMNAKKSR